MSISSKSSLLADEINLLVKHFGVQRVRAALANVSVEGEEQPRAGKKKPSVHKSIRAASVSTALESIRETYPEKYRVLGDFLRRLDDRLVLPESQDIRYFAQTVGLKEISGKSRKEMVPKLIRFLLEQPIEKVQADIRGAAAISGQQRKMGFSVLTDKLLG